MPPQACCICRSKAKGRTYSSVTYEGDFLRCFDNTIVSDRTGRLCSTCQGAVLRYRKHGIVSPHLVDKKGIVGQHGHKEVGGKRTPIPKPPVEVSTSTSKLTCPSGSTSVSVGTETDLTLQTLDSNKRKLDMLTGVDDQQPLNRHQEILYHKMTMSCLKTQSEGSFCKNFKTRPTHGPGVNLFTAPKTRVSSSTCSIQTRRNRSETIEEFHAHISCDSDSSEDDKLESLTAQRVSMLKRNKDAYFEAMESAGFKVLCKFSRDTVMNLRSRMPMASWQYVKRLMKNELGINLMGTESQLRAEVSSLQYEYECVTFNDSDTGKAIHAIRVADVGDVITRTVEHLRNSNQLQFVDNCEHETLWVHISGDKGGRSTKLMLQIINSTNRHSIKSAKILGMFEGGKDTRSNIEMAFTPVLNQLKQLGINFTLNLDLPEVTADSSYQDEASTSTQDKAAPEEMTQTLQPLDLTNQTVSADCKYCVKDQSQTSTPAVSSTNSGKFKNIRLTFGGDWEWLARLLGLSGPSGRYFCIHCLSTRPELVRARGSSYGLHEIGHGSNDWAEAGDDATGGCILRTYEGCIASNNKYREGGQVDVLNYNNCKHVPLNSDTGTVIDSISTTPLHVSLGVGLDCVNLIENMAVSVDQEIKDAEGVTSNVMNDLLTQRGDILQQIQHLEDEETTLKEQITDKEEQEEELRRRNPAHFIKANRAFVDKSREAVNSRRDLKNVTSEKAEVIRQLKDLNARKQITEQQLQAVLEKIAQNTGIFKERFDKTMNDLKLKRVVYHSGALIGPDVYKVMQAASIMAFGDIFLPTEIVTNTGKQTFGGDGQRQKVVDLLSKFADCYKIYTKNAPLCRHEVEQLCLNCAEFGAWFPLNFPDASLKPKFHMLVMEMPRQVRRLRTIGMLTEQVSESIHPYVNKLERMFASTRDVAARQKLTMRQHNLLSSV